MSWYFWLIDAIPLLYLALVYPSPHARLPTWLSKTTPWILVMVALDTAYLLLHPPGNPTPPAALVVLDQILDLAQVLVPVFLIWATLRDTSDRRWPSAMLLGLGIQLQSVLFLGPQTLITRLLGGDAAAVLSTFGMTASVVGAATRLLLAVGFTCWLLAATRAPSPPLLRKGVRRYAGTQALVLATAALTGALMASASSDFRWLVALLDGFWIVVGLSLIAYGLLRHHLLGIDVKVRWTISKTTLAGIFVAVFFIASEAAQEFFGATLGGPYVGIVAAGLLVFAISPLSRLADRVAERAVPMAIPTDADSEATFRDAVQYTLRDRRMTQQEEIHLARLAESLRIRAARATEIRHEVLRRSGRTKP